MGTWHLLNTLVPGPTATTTLSRQDPLSGVTTEDILEKFTNEPPAGLPGLGAVKHPDGGGATGTQMVSYGAGGPTGQVFSGAPASVSLTPFGFVGFETYETFCV